MMPAVVYWWAGNGWRVGLATDVGRKWAYVVALDEARGVRLFRMPKGTPCKPAADCEPRQAARRYLRMGKKWGISKRAQEVLRLAAKAR